jgi:hypothetical protein
MEEGKTGMKRRFNPTKHLWLALVLVLALVMFIATGSYAQQMKQASKVAKPAKAKGTDVVPPVQMTSEPKALDLIREACSRLTAARSMSFTAVVTYESPSRLGPPPRLYDQIPGRRPAS